MKDKTKTFKIKYIIVQNPNKIIYCLIQFNDHRTLRTITYDGHA